MSLFILCLCSDRGSYKLSDTCTSRCSSAAYVILYTGPKGSSANKDLNDSSASPRGFGMTFTIGRGNEICCSAIKSLVEHALLGKSVQSLTSDMGKTWEALVTDCQLRWLGPEKGVIHLASAAAVNAVWDLYARIEKKPLWLLIASMTPKQLVSIVPFKYISDLITPAEALAIFEAAEKDKAKRIAELQADGYPAYTTSAGWSGYDDAKVARLTRSALAQGFNHFKLKVGASLEDDKRRLALVRSIVDNPAEIPKGWTRPSEASVVGKNAGATGAVVMIDANQGSSARSPPFPLCFHFLEPDASHNFFYSV